MVSGTSFVTRTTQQLGTILWHAAGKPQALVPHRHHLRSAAVNVHDKYSRKMSNRVTGTVTWYNDDKGYGFITPDAGGSKLFAHHSSVQGGYTTLAEGMKVEFEITIGPKGPQDKSCTMIKDISP